MLQGAGVRHLARGGGHHSRPVARAALQGVRAGCHRTAKLVWGVRRGGLAMWVGAPFGACDREHTSQRG